MIRSKWYRLALTVAGTWALTALAVPAQAQQTGTVSGSVTEAGTGRPLRGVQLFIPRGRCPGTERSCPRVTAVTDEAGQYTLATIPAGQAEIRARLVGYSSQSTEVAIVAGQTFELNFTLRASVISLDEIVVTGAGVAQSKKQLGNTIVTVNPSDLIRTQSVQTFSEALAAREPGVIVSASGGGIAGESARIQIRGVSSMAMRNIPVVYVDGVRIDNGQSMYIAASGGGGRSRPFDNINPESIERIEVLKGAAAATLYGSEASAGVIQIFTKKGSAGAPRINVNLQYGLSTVDKDRIPSLTAFPRDVTQQNNMNNIFNANIGLYETLETTLVKDLLGTGTNYVFASDVSGGSEDFQYFVSGRWTKEDGVILDDLGPGGRDINRRLQGSAQFTLFPRDRFSFRLSTMFTDQHQEQPPNNNNIYGFISSALNGQPWRANCDNSGFVAEYGKCSGAGNPGGQAAFATTRETAQRFIEGNLEHFNASMTGTYQAAQTLNVDVTFGIDATNQTNFDFRPFANDVDDFTNVRDDGIRYAGNRNHRELTIDTRATWSERFGNISSQLVFGGQGFISRNKQAYGRGRDFPGPGLEVVSAASDRVAYESFSEQVNIGILAQEQIGINDWLYLTGGGRWDRNSAFGDSTEGAFYPKVSLSIIPSDLPSWTSTTISSLRFRAALGKSGQQPGAFDRFTTFSSLAAATGAGIQPENLGNLNLKPETSREIEFGGEIGLWNDIAALDVTYWTRETTDALVENQFPVTGGFRNTQLDNIGLMAAHGWEIKFNALVIDRENLTIDVFANGAFLAQEIQSMGGAPPIKQGGSYPRYRAFLMGPDTLAAGISCDQVIAGNICRDGVVYYAPGAKLGGKLIPQCSENAVYTQGGSGGVAGAARTCWTRGSTVPFDTDGDGLPDSEATLRAFLVAGGVDLSDLQSMLDDEDGDGDVLDNFLGKPDPDWAGAFGVNITLQQNLQINALFEYKVGAFSVNNLSGAFRTSHPLIGRNTPEAAAVEAAILNPAASSDDKLAAALEWAESLQALAPYSGLNTVWNAKFLRFRELGMTYTAPRSFASKLGFNNLAFNLSGRNLALWTPYGGIDPELNAGSGDNFLQSVEGWGVGIPRRYTLSVRFGF